MVTAKNWQKKHNASKLNDTKAPTHSQFQHYYHPVNSINSVIVLLITQKKQSNNYVNSYDENSHQKLLNWIAKVVILLIFLLIISYDSIRFRYYFVASLLWVVLTGVQWNYTIIALLLCCSFWVQFSFNLNDWEDSPEHVDTELDFAYALKSVAPCVQSYFALRISCGPGPIELGSVLLLIEIFHIVVHFLDQYHRIVDTTKISAINKKKSIKIASK